MKEISLLGVKRGLYAATENGEIISLTTKKVMKVAEDKDGYQTLSLQREKGGNSRYRVHRIIAATFLTKTFSPDLQVNHKDGIKSNNSVSNLEWVTCAENLKHARDLGLNKKIYNTELTADDVEEIREMLSNGCALFEIRERFRSVNRKVLSDIRTGKTWSDVSEDVSVLESYRAKKYSRKQIEGICKGILSGLTPKENALLVFGESNSTYSQLISDIKNKRRHASVSSKFF
ncbi:MAG: HNH endonuclease signature motif containing protein [Phocaeicola sp.]